MERYGKWVSIVERSIIGEIAFLMWQLIGDLFYFKLLIFISVKVFNCLLVARNVRMRILLANKFYYARGGDCICTINLKELLKKNGHEVAIFAMDFPENIQTPWSKYFPSEIRFKPGVGMIEAFTRPFGTSEVERKFNMLLDDFHPDIVHVHNIHSQLSPIIVELAHQRGIKVVWTLHESMPAADKPRRMSGNRCISFSYRVFASGWRFLPDYGTIRTTGGILS